MPMAPALSMPGCGSHRRKAPRDKGDDPSNVPTVPQREWPEPRVPAKFEQGGFTSGRREGPQTLFPGTSPGNRAGDGRRRNSVKQYVPIGRRLPLGISTGSSAKTAMLWGIAAENFASALQRDISSAESPLLCAIENRGRR